MSKIHQLSDSLCNKIAAGEVIERPASIVKELLENSLDANAKSISISIENGGKKSITVIDDGDGMDADDALLCLDTHATSKISSDSDIMAISSFGFRGEAIPSIASVSRFRILTRQKNTTEGVEVLVNGGVVAYEKPAGCRPGTEMHVSDLFYNLPARKAFLHSTATEERHIIDIVTNISLAHPNVSFQLKADNRVVLASSASKNSLLRIREFFGKEYSESLLPVSLAENGITLSGYVAKRDFTRQSRSEQRIYVNYRPVESQVVYHAIREACGPMLERGKFLPSLLFLTLNPGNVDVNVHPTKREVRFRNEYNVINIVRSGISSALRLHDTVIPQSEESFSNPASLSGKLFSDFSPGEEPLDLSKGKKNRNQNQSTGQEQIFTAPALQNSLESFFQSVFITYHPIGPNPLIPAAEDSNANNGFSQKNRASMKDEAEKSSDNTPVPSGEDAASNRGNKDSDFQLFADDAPVIRNLGNRQLEILGVLENSYIIAKIRDGLVLIDQHAAHERVLFEKIINGIDGSLSQKLLFPIPIELSPGDTAYVVRNIHEFESIGFELEPFGQNTVKITSIPAAIPQENVSSFFRGMLGRISELGAGQKLDITLLARAACKAAVKAHDKLDKEQAVALLEQMSHCALPYSCPHGRPTILNISLSEIEHRFGRK